MDAACTEMVEGRVQLLVIVTVYIYVHEEERREEGEKEKGESKVSKRRSLLKTSGNYTYHLH